METSTVFAMMIVSLLLILSILMFVVLALRSSAQTAFLNSAEIDEAIDLSENIDKNPNDVEESIKTKHKRIMDRIGFSEESDENKKTESTNIN